MTLKTLITAYAAGCRTMKEVAYWLHNKKDLEKERMKKK